MLIEVLITLFVSVANTKKSMQEVGLDKLSMGLSAMKLVT